MANIRENEAYKFGKKLAWYTFAAIALVGLAASATNWVTIKGVTIPPVIKAGAAA